MESGEVGEPFICLHLKIELRETEHSPFEWLHLKVKVRPFPLIRSCQEKWCILTNCLHVLELASPPFET